MKDYLEKQEISFFNTKILPFNDFNKNECKHYVIWC